jgi:hypothetical protein
MPSATQQVITSVHRSSGASLVEDFEKIEKQFPEFAAAFKYVALTACADSVGNDTSRSRGNFLTDVGPSISHLMIHAALKVMPNRALGEKIAGQLNAAWELQAAKNSLQSGTYQAPAQIDLGKY